MVELSIIIVILLLIIVFSLSRFSKYKKQVVKIYTIESFLNGHHLIENEDQKKNLIDRINDIFDGSKDNRVENGEDDDGGDSDGDGGGD